jgi:hypothetical protein
MSDRGWPGGPWAGVRRGRIAWQVTELRATQASDGYVTTRTVYEAWRQVLIGGVWQDTGTQRGFGPSLEAALAGLLRSEHAAGQ